MPTEVPTEPYRKARLLFLACLVVAGLGGLAWYLWSSDQYRTYKVETADTVSGLIPGSPVEFHGVEVGKVTEVALEGDRKVGIVVSIAKQAPISTATVATVMTRGLAAKGFTGYVLVALENTRENKGQPAGPLKVASGQRYPVIPAAPSRIVTMDTQVAEATQAVQAVRRMLEPLLDEEGVASFKRSMAGLADLTTVLADNKQRLQSLIDNLERDSRDIRPLIEALQDDKTVGSLKQSIENLGGLTATLAANTQHLESLLANVDRDSRDIRPLIETSGALVQELRTRVLPPFDHAIGELNRLSRTMTTLAGRLERNPSDLLRGTVTAPGPGER
jgi:ABC-type transporter Mla subunit MlaD